MRIRWPGSSAACIRRPWPPIKPPLCPGAAWTTTRIARCAAQAVSGVFWSQARSAPGNLNNLSVRVQGTQARLEWHGDDPEKLLFTPLGEPARTILRGGPGTMSEAARFSRMPGAHPEGYVEGFGNLYRDAAHLIAARRAGVSPDPAIAAVMPTVEVGLAGLRFIEASVNSHEAGGVWTGI